MAVKKNKKAEAQRRHAKDRALIRFGVTLTDQMYYELVQLIRRGVMERIPVKQSNRIAHFYVPLGEKTAVCVYDKMRQTIVTFLYTADDIDALSLEML